MSCITYYETLLTPTEINQQDLVLVIAIGDIPTHFAAQNVKEILATSLVKVRESTNAFSYSAGKDKSIKVSMYFM